MKKKSAIALVLVLSMLFCMVLTSCAERPKDLESFIHSNEDIKEQIESAANANDLSIDIKGNVVTYSFDIATLEGIEEETLKEPEMLEKLQSTLDSQDSSFIELCKNLEDKTGFTDISVVVNYKYGEEILATKTYTSEGSSAPSEESESLETSTETSTESE